MSDVLVAKQSFATDVLGHPRVIRAGETFRVGHAITEAHPDLFRDWKPDNDVDETATKGKRNVNRAAAPAVE